MKNKITILSFLFFNFSILAFGQKFEYYKISFCVSYPPSGNSYYEEYCKEKENISHIGSNCYWDVKKHDNVIEKKKLNEELKIEQIINNLDSLFKLTKYTFQIDKSVIDSIKANEYYKKEVHIDNGDIEKFFSHHDTLCLKIKDIKKDKIDGHVIDGAPFSFNLVFKKQNQDTIKYMFYGNLLDDVKTANIKNWLSFFLIYKQYGIFATLPINDYFNNKHLEYVLYDYIIWTKKK